MCRILWQFVVIWWGGAIARAMEEARNVEETFHKAVTGAGIEGNEEGRAPGEENKKCTMKSVDTSGTRRWSMRCFFTIQVKSPFQQW